jgi:hypothetical protein
MSRNNKINDISRLLKKMFQTGFELSTGAFACGYTALNHKLKIIDFLGLPACMHLLGGCAGLLASAVGAGHPTD